MLKTQRLALLGGTPLITEPLPRWPSIDDQDIRAVLNTLKNEELSAYEVNSGPLFDFEAELRARFNVKYALLVSSGTAALQSAIFALSRGMLRVIARSVIQVSTIEVWVIAAIRKDSLAMRAYCS